MYNSIGYIIYILISIWLILYVGKLFHVYGEDFLFHECPEKQTSHAANNILYVCYCLVNIGLTLYFLNTCSLLNNLIEVIEFISRSFSFILILLSILHILNMFFAPLIINFYLKNKSFT